VNKYKELELLIKPMNLPPYRKKVVNNNDLRWLGRNLAAKNSEHKNFAKAKEIIDELL
jgi:hypothetical protein